MAELVQVQPGIWVAGQRGKTVAMVGRLFVGGQKFRITDHDTKLIVADKLRSLTEVRRKIDELYPK